MELKHESITLSSLVRRALNPTCSILICFSREGGGVLAPGFLRSLYRRVQGILRSLLACVGAAETMPAHGPCRKSLNLLQISLPACEKPFLNILFVDCPNKSALNAISSRSKTET